MDDTDRKDPLVVNPTLRVSVTMHFKANGKETHVASSRAEAAATFVRRINAYAERLERTLDPGELLALFEPDSESKGSKHSSIFECKVTSNLEWAVPGRGRQVLDVDFSDEDSAAMVQLALEVERRGGIMSANDLAMDEDTQATLATSGILIPSASTPEPRTLDIVLDRTSEGVRPPHATDWVANASVRRVDDANDPSGPLFRGSKEVTLTPDTLLVRNPDTGVELPVTLGEGLAVEWAALQRGPEHVSAQALEAFVSSGLAVAPGTAARGYASKAASALSTEDYAVLPKLLPAFHCERLRRYWLALTRSGQLQLGDGQDRLRYVQYREPVMEGLHKAIESVVDGATIDFGGCKASYSYFSVYQRGSVLPRHRDRPQCRWNVSICLGSDPPEARWPIYLETRAGVQEVTLHPGDGLLYAGTDLWHWRDHFLTGRFHGVAFFHFVDKSVQDLD